MIMIYFVLFENQVIDCLILIRSLMIRLINYSGPPSGYSASPYGQIPPSCNPILKL